MLSAKLKELRKHKGISIRKLAEGVGISDQHVWQLETGKSKNPSIEILRSYARYFNVTVEFLSQPGEQADPAALAFFLDFQNRLSPDDRHEIRSFAESLCQRLNVVAASNNSRTPV